MARSTSPYSARRLLTQSLEEDPSGSREVTPRSAGRQRAASPEPYRKSTARYRQRHRSRSKDRRRKERSRDARRPRSRSHSRVLNANHAHRSYRRSPSRSRSPQLKRQRRSPSHSRSPMRPSPHRASRPLPPQEVSFRGIDDSALPPTKYGGAPTNKETPNFKTTGALAKHANRVEGTKISLKYHEPPEARKPSASNVWRMFVFKGDQVVDTVELWQRSCWLLGRAHEVVDFVLEHPSTSGQHAVIQFRYIERTIKDEFGVKHRRGKVRPYIIDLDSSNGTTLNDGQVEPSRYLELRNKDILKFAGSEREYVIMLPPPDDK